MSWSIIRKATEEDVAKLETRSKAFAERHNLPVEADEDTDWYDTVFWHLEYEIENNPCGFYRPRYMMRLFNRVTERALEPGAEGIAHGYVGYHVS